MRLTDRCLAEEGAENTGRYIMWKPLNTAIFVLGLSWWCPGSVQAVVVIPVDDSPGLAAAILSVPDGGVIELAPDTYPSPASGSFLILNPNKSFTIRAQSTGTAILDGGSSRRVLKYTVTNPAQRGEVIFEGLIFRNGFSDLVPGTAAGVTVTDGTTTFVDCRFENNVSSPPDLFAGGGGIGVFAGSTAKFVRTVFSGNTAKNAGAGLQIGGGSVVFIHDSQFLDNRADLEGHSPAAAGGGIHLGNSTLRVANTRFEGNHTGFAGGAIFAIGAWDDATPEPSSDVIVANSTFINNISLPFVVDSTRAAGGAIHIENETTLTIHNSRFTTNVAGAGGAISFYRGSVEIHSSVFLGNSTMGTAAEKLLGGTIAASSDDTSADGENNRPPASLFVQDTFIQGSSAGAAAEFGGCVYITGDVHRMYGLGTTTQDGTLADNRSPVEIRDVVFADCDVADLGSGFAPFGGGLYTALVDMILDSSMFLDSDATTSLARGGALAMVNQSAATITASTFARNSAELSGGAGLIAGSDITMDDCIFLDNEVSPGVDEPIGDSKGAALHIGTQVAFGTDMDATGTVSNSIFTENIGLPIFDEDRLIAAGQINDTRYDGNTIFNTTFGPDIFRNSIGGVQTVAELNSLIVDRDGSTPGNCQPPNPANPPECTDKSQVDNISPPAMPTVGRLAAVPPAIIDRVAVGDAETSTEAFLAFGWSGACAKLDGLTLAAATGWETAGTGVHTLEVFDNPTCQQPSIQDDTATITQGQVPTVSFTATPVMIDGGQESTLAWDISPGASFLDGLVDHGVGDLSSALGSQQVSPATTTTYRLCGINREGGVTTEETVYVDEPPPSLIFADGFESGDTSAW